MGIHLKFIWEDSYCTNNKDIDEAHKHFFDVANDICDLSDKDTVSADELILKINKLDNYILGHFSSEEINIKKHDTEDDVEFHIKEHNVFRGKIAAYMNKPKDAGTDIKKLTDEIANFVEEWISGHIFQVTKEIVVEKTKIIKRNFLLIRKAEAIPSQQGCFLTD